MPKPQLPLWRHHDKLVLLHDQGHLKLQLLGMCVYQSCS